MNGFMKDIRQRAAEQRAKQDSGDSDEMLVAARQFFCQDDKNRVQQVVVGRVIQGYRCAEVFAEIVISPGFIADNPRVMRLIKTKSDTPEQNQNQKQNRAFQIMAGTLNVRMFFCHHRSFLSVIQFG